MFSVIMVTYNRLDLLKQALSALRRQTYADIEIIVVNNGSTDGTAKHLVQAEEEDHRIKVVHFKENQHTLDDPNMPMAVCTTAGLEKATGDYVWYQNDDDMAADDYLEKMVALFAQNPECTSAAGLPVSVDFDGNILSKGLRSSNYRPRYMPGNLLALNASRGAGVMFNSPGAIFAFKRKSFIKSGGFHRDIEASQLYGMVPFGVTGFDETAEFYWRRHPGQGNLVVTQRGWVGFVDYRLTMLKEWKIEERWRIFGNDIASQIARDISSQSYSAAANWFVGHLTSYRILQASRIILKMWHHRRFWTATAVEVSKINLLAIPNKLFRRVDPRRT